MARTRPEFPASRFHGDPVGAEDRGPPSRFIVFDEVATFTNRAWAALGLRKNGATPAIAPGVGGLPKKIGEHLAGSVEEVGPERPLYLWLRRRRRCST